MLVILHISYTYTYVASDFFASFFPKKYKGKYKAHIWIIIEFKLVYTVKIDLYISLLSFFIEVKAMSNFHQLN